MNIMRRYPPQLLHPLTHGFVFCALSAQEDLHFQWSPSEGMFLKSVRTLWTDTRVISFLPKTLLNAVGW